MATEFNPGGPVRNDNRTTTSGERNIWPTVAAIVAIAALIVGGLIYSLKDTNKAASNSGATQTTGMSTSPSTSGSSNTGNAGSR